MTYRWPIKTGDRVAIAPHHDLWMAGCRFGTVTSAQESLASEPFYFIDLDTGRNVTLAKSDLLGAVGPIQTETDHSDDCACHESTAGATMCEQFTEDRTPIYYVTCSAITAKPSVVMASHDYEIVKEWRDTLAARVAETGDGCTEPHPIRTQFVRFL